eukprot:1861391-Prymnesium_polylepis.1
MATEAATQTGSDIIAAVKPMLAILGAGGRHGALGDIGDGNDRGRRRGGRERGGEVGGGRDAARTRTLGVG